MYKNSPPELQHPVLVTLRAAFMAAVSSLNAVMAENEYVQTQLGHAPSMPPPQVAEYDGTDGTDENTQFFEGVYSKLKAAAGSGKVGLREDLSADEAADLADDIAEMRARLVEELDQGIL
jgi:hypothetical protein